MQRRLAPVLITGLLGCAASVASLPRHLQTGRHASFPPDQYLTGVGVSREGRAAAEVQARAEVCRQVRSHIEATTEELATWTQAGGRSETVTRLVQRALQSARCDYGEAIRVIPDLGGVYDGQHHAFAVLSRREALAALLPAFEADAAVFRERARAALAEAGDVFRFTAHHDEAMRALERALPRGLEIRSIAGGPFEPVREVFALQADLLRAASEVRARTVIAVVPGSAPEPGALRRCLTRWLESSGLRTAEAPWDPGGLLLRADAVEECRSRMGVCCTWSISATLCDGTGSRCAPVRVPPARGCHRRDTASARDELMRACETGDALPSAAESLSGRFPFPTQSSVHP